MDRKRLPMVRRYLLGLLFTVGWAIVKLSIDLAREDDPDAEHAKGTVLP